MVKRLTPAQLLKEKWRGPVWNWSKKVYHSNVTNNMKIGQYIKNFPVRIELQRGTKTAVQRACQKYLGRSYLYMVHYKVQVHKEGTWVYHNGILYLKNPGDEAIITMALLTKNR